MAFAVIIFAAGSVASMTALAYPEISQGSEPVIAGNFTYSQREQVLGDSTTTNPSLLTINDSALEAAGTFCKISAKPLSYDSSPGRWDYNISYSLPNFVGSATLDIGTYAIQQNITSSGTTETGTILKPGRVYHLTLWLTDQSGNQEGAIRYELKTAKAKSPSTSALGHSLPLCALPQAVSASSSPMAMPNFCR